MNAARKARPRCAINLEKARQDLLADLSAGRIGAGFPAFMAQAVDAYFASRLREYEVKHGRSGAYPCIAAVGGYGRSELCPGSDLDVLFLFKDEVPEKASEVVSFVLLPLWDMGLELGHGVRCVKDNLELAAKDYQVLASLLDLRYVCGARTPYKALHKALAKGFWAKHRGRFAAWLRQANHQRAAMYGDASAMLEPDLKQGLGGLRDYHQINWQCKLGLASPRADWPSQRSLDECVQAKGEFEFLLLVRSHLHRLAGRKTDRLSFEYQEGLAKLLGFSDQGPVLAVENFLSRLHNCMNGVKTLRRAVSIEALAETGKPEKPGPVVEDGLSCTPAGIEFSRPGPQDLRGMLNLFTASAKHGVEITLRARRRVQASLPEVSAEVAARREQGLGGAEIFEALKEIFLAPDQGQALETMFETGLIGAVLREFYRVQEMVQFDAYHVHPVGRHTIETILAIKAAQSDPEDPSWAAIGEVEDKLLLYYGAFFHDIGKGLGGDHSNKGQAIARESLTFLGAPEDFIDEVEFLIKQHLLLPEVASRRDIDDRELVARLATRIGSLNRLHMLLALSLADSKATGPAAYSQWKASLISGLYLRIRNVLERNLLFEPGDAPRMLRTRDRVRALAAGTWPPETIEANLDEMPARYLINLSAEEIIMHLKMLTKLEQGMFSPSGARVNSASHHVVCDGGVRLTVVAKNEPDLFTDVAGVLSLQNINIRFANLFLWENGVVILDLVVSEPADALYMDEIFGRVEQGVDDALCGRLALDYRLAQRRRSPLMGNGPECLRKPAKVNVNNKSSEYFSLIEVAADDRLGLLYDIADTLRRLRLQLHLAKIDTHNGQIFDVFYVRDSLGRKIEDEQHARELAAALEYKLSIND